MTFFRHVVRFIVAALVLMVVSWMVPGFRIAGFWNALVTSLFIAAIGWGIEMLLGARVSPYSRGVTGFLVSAVVIYVSQYFISGVRASLLGAILASLVIGVIDLFIPIKPRFGNADEIRER